MTSAKARSFFFIERDGIPSAMSVEVNDIQVGRKRGKSFDFLAKPFAKCRATFSRSLRIRPFFFTVLRFDAISS